MEAFGRPVVSLESGAGAENPPCPACGEPLFGWALIRPEGIPARRCEACSMAVVGGPARPEEAREAIVAAVTEGRALPNRRSLQASLGSSGWSLLERDSRFAFTPEAAVKLGAIPERARFSPTSMWQTLLNAFTFGHNVALGRLGRARSAPARGPLRRSVDAAISVLAAAPLSVVAVALEGTAWALGRGGTFKLGHAPAELGADELS